MLERRISIFCSLPMHSIDKLALQKRLDEIGKSRSKPEPGGALAGLTSEKLASGQLFNSRRQKSGTGLAKHGRLKSRMLRWCNFELRRHTGRANWHREL